MKVLPLIHGTKYSMPQCSALNIIDVPNGIRYELQSNLHYRFVVVTRYDAMNGFNSISEIQRWFGMGWMNNPVVKYLGKTNA